MGYLDFDGVRYWDVREKEKWYFRLEDFESDCLPSDANRRPDVMALAIKGVEAAQVEKDAMHEQAVKDEEMREEAASRREANGFTIL